MIDNLVPLTEADLAALERDYITPELAHQAARRADSAKGSEISGRNGHADYSGIVFSYRQPWDPSNTVLYVLRRDYPDLEMKDGKTKEKAKYLVAPGSPQRLYFPPGVDDEWLKDATLSILLLEGEKKALAALRLALHGLGEASERPRFLPIGLRGVYGWRGKRGTETGPNGQKFQVHGVIADFDRIAWRGRPVTICFDRNVESKAEVKKALEELTTELQRRGAKVSIFQWPVDTPSQVNGLDDYLGIVGPEPPLKLISEAIPVRPTARQQAEFTREFENVREDGYKLSIPSLGIEFDIDRLRREHNELVGELCVRCELPGAKTYDGALSIADFNLSSARARTDRAKLLKDRAQIEEFDWFALLEEFCQRVLTAERSGQPAVDLRTLARPDINSDDLWVEGLNLPRRHPTIIFGDGGTAKSYTALYLAGRLAQSGSTVALFDWELAGEDHRDRLERLFGSKMPLILYARCERPLAYEVDRLARIVRERGVSFAVCDSISFAVDGPPESAEIAGRYFRAVRQIGVGSLHVAHISRGEGNDQKPFGSAFWHNGARSTWFAKCTDASADGSKLNVGFFNRKANLGRLRPPTGFQITFDNERTIFARVNPADTPDLAAQMSTRQRMAHLLKHGAMTVEDIANQIDAKAETISREARRYKQTFTILEGGQVALLNRSAS